MVGIGSKMTVRVRGVWVRVGSGRGGGSQIGEVCVRSSKVQTDERNAFQARVEKDKKERRWRPGRNIVGDNRDRQTDRQTL